LIDVEFYQKSHQLKKELLSGDLSYLSKKDLFELFESYRSIEPIVYDIETTNNCNLRCPFCPRTTKMTRPISTMSDEIFKKVVSEIRPWSRHQWLDWVNFCERVYDVKEDGPPSENHFFLYVVAKCITLHGYGNPILDKNLASRVGLLSGKKIPSYFSYSPPIISVDKILEVCDAGLSYLKFSIDSTMEALRGEKKKFDEYGPQILYILNKIRQKRYGTKVVITMIDLGRENQQEDWKSLQEFFIGTNAYVYLKSQDQTHVVGKPMKNKSIHWTEACLFPWSSLTVAASGEVVSCPEDFNCSLVVGDLARNSLFDIWNSKEHRALRESHFNNSNSYCQRNCSMKMIGEYI
jgi:radical SAM protein with 4Fe4S-binding SPASM domain